MKLKNIKIKKENDKKIGIVVINNSIVMVFKDTNDKIFNEYKRLSKSKTTNGFNPKAYKIIEV